MVASTEKIPLAPQIVRADEGVSMGHGPENIRVFLSSAATGGAFTLGEVRIAAPAYGPPYHVHSREDETFQVLEGELVLIVDGERIELRAGDCAFAPRNVPHRFESGPDGVRFVVMATGDNFERFFPRYCAACNAGEMHLIPGIAGEHGIALLGEIVPGQAQPDSLAARIVRAEEGRWLRGGPESSRTIFSSEETGGSFFLAETRVEAPNYGPPPHVHSMEDETFTVLEGEMTVVVDGVAHALKAGDTAFAPRGVPHTWISGPDGVRMTILANGGNFERAYARILSAIDAREMHRLDDIVAEHGIRFVS